MKPLKLLTLFVALTSLYGVAAKETISSTSQEQTAEGCKIVISKEEMTLTVYDSRDSVVVVYPIACGKNYGNKQRVGDMKTPEGAFHVSSIQDASAWTHDFRDGKGEIKGAYGPYFIRLHTPPHKGIGIHGTHAPSSIGTRATEGCIRLENSNLRALMRYIYINMPVVITSSHKDRQADGK